LSTTKSSGASSALVFERHEHLRGLLKPENHASSEYFVKLKAPCYGLHIRRYEICVLLVVDMLKENLHDTGGESIGQIYDQLYTPDGLVLNAAGFNTPVIYVAMNYRVSSKSKSLVATLN
jgi:hypothetical protein